MTLDFLETSKRSVSVVVDHEDDYDNLLSEEARRNFDVIRSMLVADNCNESSSDVTGFHAHESSVASEPPAVRLKRRKLAEVASATVRMIQDEIAHWQRSIAELERMVVGRVDVEGEQPAELSPVDSCDLGGRERLRNLNGLLVRSQDGELSSRPNSSTQDGEVPKEFLRQTSAS